MASQKRLTARQIAEALPGIPTTTLYRHIHLLLKGDVLKVVEQHQVRGATQRVYEFVEGSTSINIADSAGISRQDILRIFSAFMSSTLADGEIALAEQEGLNFTSQGLAFRSFFLALTQEQARELVNNLTALTEQMEDTVPSTESKVHRVTIIVLPAAAGLKDDLASEEASDASTL